MGDQSLNSPLSLRPINLEANFGPNFDGKHAEDSLINPQHYVEYLKSLGKVPDVAPPKGVILCYQRKLLAHIVDLAAVYTVSDSLADLKWHPEFRSPKTKEGLESIYRAAVAAF